MKMILAIVQADDAAKVTAALIEGGHRVTRVATEGGWLRKENSTLLMGIEDDKVDDVLKILKGTTRRRTSYFPASAVADSDPTGLSPGAQLRPRLRGSPSLRRNAHPEW